MDQTILSEVTELQSQLRSLQEAAGELVAKLRDVGERTNWKDGIETDRVFTWDEFSKLRALLPLEIMSQYAERAAEIAADEAESSPVSEVKR